MALDGGERLRSRKWRIWWQEKRQEARAFLRRSERKETKSPATAFIEGTPHGRNAHNCAEGRAGRRTTVAHFPPGEKFEAPTPSDSHARRTRALNFAGETSRPIRAQRHGRFESPRAAPQKERPEKLRQDGSF